MKRILTIILILIGFSAFAQPSNEGQYQASYARWKQKVPLWADSGIYVKKIAKMANQNRVCVFDSVTGKTGYKYISTTSSGWDLSGNSLSDGQFLGSTNNRDLRIRTNNVEWANFDSLQYLQLKGGSSGATLGSEQITLAADRDFSSNTGNWTGTNWTIGGGVATHTAGANNFTLSNSALSAAPVSGTYYRISFTVSTTVEGELYVRFGNVYINANFGKATATGGVYYGSVLSTGTSQLSFEPNAVWTGTIDNISIQIITPNKSVFKLLNSSSSDILNIYSQKSSTDVCIGNSAGINNTSGGNNENTFIGSLAGNYNYDGTLNTAVGSRALQWNVNSTNNVAIGRYSLNQHVYGSYNVAVGNNSSSSLGRGDYNTTIGHSSLQNANGIIGSSIYGYQSGLNKVTGDNCSFYGYLSGYNNTTGTRNNFFGASSGYSLGGGTGSRNNIHGTSAGDSLGSGSDNAFFGDLSGNTLARGKRNSFYGGRSGELARDSDNVFLGYLSGGSQRAGSNNLAIGSQINTQSSSASNQISIRNIIFGTGVVGTGTTTATGKLGIKYPNPLFGFSVNAKVGLNKDSITVSSGQEWYLTLDTTTTPNQVKRQKVSSSSYSAGNGLLLGGTTFYADTTKIASLHGNAWGNGMFSGTTNNRSIFWRTNNLQRMKLDSIGYLWLWGTTSNSGLRLGYNSTDQGMIWSNNVTPSTSNFALNTRGDYTFVNATSNVYLGVGGSDKVIVSSASTSISHNLVMTGSTSTIILKGYTVATLPSGTVGMTAYVTDALAPTYLGIAVGGGAIKAPVFFDGTNWITH